MISGIGDEFHDHSTFMGKVSMYFNRLSWKHVPAAVILLGLLGVGVLIVVSNQDAVDDNPTPLRPEILPSGGILMLSAATPGKMTVSTVTTVGKKSIPANEWDPIKASPADTFEAEGCENGLMVFDNFGSVKPSMIKNLKLRDLIINAPSLSKALETWTNLETIVIENAWVDGDFSRVYLPKLKKFIFHQFHNDKTDTYKLQDKLKSILFFDQVDGKTWNLEKDLLNLNITIQVTIGGTKILDVEPDSGEIMINTHYCEDVLRNFNGGFELSTVSLHWCPVTNASLGKFPKGIKTLQFNNAVPNNDDLATLIGSLRQLRDFQAFLRFHCGWPGYEIYLNISQFPQTVESISVNNLDITYVPGMGSSITSLSIGEYFTPAAIEDFASVFRNLKSVAIFNVTATQAYPLLRQVLFTPAEWILVTHFSRVNINTTKVGVELEIEAFLHRANVPVGQMDFLIESVNGTYTGRCLTVFERNYFRFMRLGFKNIDTYEDYITWDAFPQK